MKSIRAFIVAAVVVAVGIGSVVAPAGRAQADTAPSLGDFRMRRTDLDLLDRVERLDALLPKLGVQKILDQANRTATRGDACNLAAFDPAGAATAPQHWCFEPDDAGTIGSDVSGDTEWMPQGVTTSADAEADERWGTKKVIIVSWYDKRLAPKKGVRLSFLDPDTGKYRHVLLAYPYINGQGDPTWEFMDSPQGGTNGGLHAGGIVWYGNYLYVMDTRRGVRVFDMRYIFDLGSADNGDTADSSRMGRHDGIYYGHGYRYVMPQVDAWVNDAGPDNSDGTNCSPSGAPKFSYGALDRSSAPDQLVTGEYCLNQPATADGRGRVASWPLNESTGEPLLNGAGKWQATSAFRLPGSSTQGAVVHDGTWYLSQSAGSSRNGRLIEATPSGSPTGTLVAAETRLAGIGVEDLSYWPSQDAVWTVTEHPGRRAIYSCPLTPPAGARVCGPTG
jgi:hypothetical protein